MTEQIDAILVSGVNDFNYLVVTRVTATTLMVPLLVFYADFLALTGSYFALNMSQEMNIILYLE